MNYFSVGIIAKDENPYLKELVEYYKIVGADKIYIYDNESKIPIKETLKEYIPHVVEVVPIYGKCMQFMAYNDCLNRFGHLNKWIAFVDADEFIVPKSVNSLPEFLKDYEQFGGFAVNWLVFGSSGHLKKPEGLQTLNFQYRSEKDHPINNHIKTIVQPAKTVKVGPDPHHFIYKSGYICVNENGIQVKGPFSPNSTNKIQLNHYHLRSQEEFIDKVNRGRADTGGMKDINELYATDKFSNIVHDNSIVKYSEQIKI